MLTELGKSLWFCFNVCAWRIQIQLHYPVLTHLQETSSAQKLFRPMNLQQSVTGDCGHWRTMYRRHLMEIVLRNVHGHWNLIIHTLKLLKQSLQQFSAGPNSGLWNNFKAQCWNGHTPRTILSLDVAVLFWREKDFSSLTMSYLVPAEFNAKEPFQAHLLAWL